MIITLDEAKQFLRLETDFTDEDEFINSLIMAAEQYIKNATGKAFDNTNQLAVLAVKLLISHWYDNRQIDTSNNVSKLNFSLDCILTQLTYCKSESGETA